jgi:hypothetical protein
MAMTNAESTAALYRAAQDAAGDGLLSALRQAAGQAEACAEGSQAEGHV